MYTKPTLWAEVDQQGRLVLPPEVAQQYGFDPGSKMRIDEGTNDIRLHRSVTHLAKMHVEPTNQCNLECSICMQRIWDEPPGLMAERTFQSILAGAREFSPPPSIFFGGLGEPLSHAKIFDWIAQAKALECKVELITNGTLLTKPFSHCLIEAGLDVLWVSIDGATPESYADLRQGAELPRVVENLSYLRKIRKGGHFPKPAIGIAFVAMKRNIDDLPKVISLGKKVGAKQFLVTNVMPYSEDTQAEMLYKGTLRNITYLPSPFLPKLRIPRMDINETTQDAFLQALNSGCNVELAGYNLGGANDVCTFIESGSLAIGWQGSVSPCPPLLHDHVSYLNGWKRFSRKHVIGNINERGLEDMWLDGDYVAYRQRVQSFGFAPCTPCGGCELLEANEEDCYGITHPACGSCLWAQGVIQCP